MEEDLVTQSRRDQLRHLPHVGAAWAWFRHYDAPTYWVAPLVGLSEQAFRILCRRHNAQMAHTEMADAGGFARSAGYRDQIIGRHLVGKDAVDSPLILQLGGSDIETLVAAAKVAVDDGRCDAIELNCGCPQRCAKKGGYGAFLLEPDRQPHLFAILRALRKTLPEDMPLLAKIRVLPRSEDTVTLAQEMVEAGVGLLTIHGRTRRQGGGARTVGEDGERLASWPQIRAVKAAVPIPCVTNGNVLDFASAKAALEFTRCDAVMSGCGILRDPALFEGDASGSTENEKWARMVALACEYLDLAISHSSHFTQISKHLLWMLDACGFKRRLPELRDRVVELKASSDITQLASAFHKAV